MNEQELIHRCRLGDRAAFAGIVGAVQQRALFLALRLLRDETEAKDVVQSCFVRALERIDQFDENKPFYPWFRVIVKHECFKQIERRQKMSGEERFEERGRPSEGELPLALRQALTLLGPQDREIISLRHFEDRSYAEIADLLGIPQGTVMSRLHGARARLRELMRQEP